MYEYFHGKLIEKALTFAIVDVQGIGYKLHLPPNVASNLPDIGENIFLYTSWVVRETSHTLYAFMMKEERDLFEILLTCSGIGPKTALNVIGHFELTHLAELIATANSAALSEVPGIGKKTAEKLIVDLKGKLKGFSLPKKTACSSKLQDALNALLGLGCCANSAEQAVRQAMDKLSDACDLSNLITAALQLYPNNLKKSN